MKCKWCFFVVSCLLAVSLNGILLPSNCLADEMPDSNEPRAALTIGIPFTPPHLGAWGYGATDGYGEPSSARYYTAIGLSVGIEAVRWKHLRLGGRLEIQSVLADYEAPTEGEPVVGMELFGMMTRLMAYLGHDWQPSPALELGYRFGMGMSLLSSDASGVGGSVRLVFHSVWYPTARLGLFGQLGAIGDLGRVRSSDIYMDGSDYLGMGATVEVGIYLPFARSSR